MEQLIIDKTIPKRIRFICADGAIVSADARAMVLWSGYLGTLVRRDCDAEGNVLCSRMGIAGEKACSLVVEWCEYFYDQLVVIGKDHHTVADEEQLIGTHHASASHEQFLLEWKRAALGIEADSEQAHDYKEIEQRWSNQSIELRQWEASQRTIKIATAKALNAMKNSTPSISLSPSPSSSSSSGSSTTSSSSLVIRETRHIFAEIVLIARALQLDALFHWLMHADASGSDIIDEKRLSLNEEQLRSVTGLAARSRSRRLSDDLSAEEQDAVLASIRVGTVTWNRDPTATNLEFLLDQPEFHDGDDTCDTDIC
jgi:hypothetical protein